MTTTNKTKIINELDPVRVISKIKNNRLTVIREKLGMSQRQFAEWIGISYGLYNSIENMSVFPSEEVVRILSEKIGSVVEEAFPEYLRGIKSNHIERTIPETEIFALTANVERKLIAEDNSRQEFYDVLDSQLDMLSPRLQLVLRLRFGLDGEPKMALDEIGQRLGVCKEQARRLIEQGLRELRKPRIAGCLKRFI